MLGGGVVGMFGVGEGWWWWGRQDAADGCTLSGGPAGRRWGRVRQCREAAGPAALEPRPQPNQTCSNGGRRKEKRKSCHIGCTGILRSKGEKKTANKQPPPLLLLLLLLFFWFSLVLQLLVPFGHILSDICGACCRLQTSSQRRGVQVLTAGRLIMPPQTSLASQHWHLLLSSSSANQTL